MLWKLIPRWVDTLPKTRAWKQCFAEKKNQSQSPLQTSNSQIQKSCKALGDMSFQVLQKKLTKFGFDMDLINTGSVERDMLAVWKTEDSGIFLVWMLF